MRNALLAVCAGVIFFIAGCSSATHSIPNTAGVANDASVVSANQSAGTTRQALSVDPIVYNSIPNPLVGISSVGFECCGVDEWGDGLNLTASGTLGSVSFVMDSWGCQKGDSSEPSTGSNPCITVAPGGVLPTFQVPITLSVYAVTATGTDVGAKLGTEKLTFNIPFRPSADPRCDASDPGAYILPSDGECHHGYPYTIVFNNFLTPINVPSQAIFSVAFNTTSSGYNPINPTDISTLPTCVNTVPSPTIYPADACGYDSLNVSAMGPSGPGLVGTVVDPNGIFAYLTNTVETCTPSSSLNDFELDDGCWAGYHPQIQVTLSSVTAPSPMCKVIVDSAGNTYTAARLGGGNQIDVEYSADTPPCQIGIYISANDGPASLDHTVVNGKFGIGVYVDNAGQMQQDHTSICVNGTSGGSNGSDSWYNCGSGTGSSLGTTNKSSGTGELVRMTPISIDHTNIDNYYAGFATQLCPNAGYPISDDHTTITNFSGAPSNNTYAWSFGSATANGNNFNFGAGHDSPADTGSCAGSSVGDGM